MTFIFSNYDALFILGILCVLFITNIEFYTEVIVISGRWHYNSLSAQGEISQLPLSLPLLEHFPTNPLQRHMPAPPLACVCVVWHDLIFATPCSGLMTLSLIFSHHCPSFYAHSNTLFLLRWWFPIQCGRIISTYLMFILACNYILVIKCSFPVCSLLLEISRLQREQHWHLLPTC